MYTLQSDTNFFDDFRDISSGEKRIVRVGTKTFEKTVTYITLKLYKKTDEEVFKMYQAVTLTTKVKTETMMMKKIILTKNVEWLE